MNNVGNTVTKLYLDDRGTIVLELVGTQTYDSIKAVQPPLLDQVSRVRRSGKPINILADISGVTGVNAGARRAAFENMKSDTSKDYHKVALVVTSILYKTIFNLITRLAQRKINIRFFSTRSAADAWIWQD